MLSPMGGFRQRGFSNNRFVLKPDVAIASEVSILSKNSLAIADSTQRKRSTFNYLKTPFLEPPHSRFPTHAIASFEQPSFRQSQISSAIIVAICGLSEGSARGRPGSPGKAMEVSGIA